MNAAKLTKPSPGTFLITPTKQKGSAFAYTGRRLAQWLETALYSVPPACGRLKTLRSKTICFFVSCGLTLRYRPDGHFAAATAARRPSKRFGLVPMAEAPFLRSASEAFANDPEQAILADERQELVRYSRAGKSSLIGAARSFSTATVWN
jgi:hypothetical protein